MYETHKKLEQAYLDMTSDDSIADMLIANEYEFDSDGNLV